MTPRESFFLRTQLIDFVDSNLVAKTANVPKIIGSA